MSASDTDLRFWLSPAARPSADHLPPPGNPVPEVLVGGSRALSRALLLAELVGADFREGAQRVREVERMPDWSPQVFLTDDVQVLHEMLAETILRLDAALDAEGRPRGPIGEVLRSSAYVMDQEGLVLRGSRERLEDILPLLKALDAYFAWALAHGLGVELDRP